MPRRIWVTTTTLGAGGPTIADNLESARGLLEHACASRPDIVCLPECFANYGIPRGPALHVAQPVPGPITDMAAGTARHHGTYVICPLLERRGEEVYNVAVLLDRRGQISGIYEKIHPVPEERYDALEGGVTPGAEAKVFDTDFGCIGILICFDINWREEWATLKKKGAEIVFWPSAYEGGRPLQTRALDHHYYVVSAVRTRHSRIIDVTGGILAETGPYSEIAEAEIDLEKRVFSTDYNLAKVPTIRARYGRGVAIETCVDEDIFTLQSRRDDVTVGRLIEEFGLEPWSDYIAKSMTAQDLRRGSR